MNKKYLAILALAGATLPMSLMAQTQRLPGVVDQPSLEDEVVPGSKSLDAEIDEPLEPAPWLEELRDADTPVAIINNIIFEGNGMVDEELLQEIAAPYLHKVMTKGDLARLKYEITTAYYEQGYILVKPVTPPQDVSDGVLTIVVHEAEIGAIRIHDPDDILNPVVAQAIAERLSEGDIFYERSVESMVSDMDDLKNIGATVNLSPGTKFRTTDLDVTLQKRDEDNNFIQVDNYGSELTGVGILTAHLEKNNLLKLGETFSLTGRVSNEELWSVEFDSRMPVGLKNIELEFNYLHSENSIGDRLAALDASGTSDSGTLALSSRLINTRTDQVTIRTGVQARLHESFLAKVTETKDDIRQVFANASYLHRGLNNVIFVEGTIRKGFSVWGGNDKGDISATRTLGDPEAWIFEPFFLINYRPGFEFLNQDGVLKVLVAGQWASAPLLSSDLFILGGYGSVRGFEPAQETGDSGYNFTVEYNHRIPGRDDWEFAGGPFVDGGTVFNRLSGVSVDRQLYSAGLGLEATTDVLVPTGRTKLRFDFAHTLGSYSSSQVYDNVGYFRVTQSF